ncbi:MAG: GreA/GreB family elongation factor [Verrucomicrobia bacterium]|nr:GreA/GreB family elongation factor [Verrucomicrobiota bacterium]
MNKEAIELLIQKHPRLKKNRAKLEAMQPGTYCIHRSWGMGIIKAYDEQSGRMLIDFPDGRTGHAMDPVFCVDKLDVLDKDDIRVKAQVNPTRIKALAKDNPADLIVEILQQLPDQSASETEIELTLARTLGQEGSKKWWTATKKLLVKDPRIAVPTKRNAPFVLRDEPVKAEDEVLDEFFETKAPKKKINLASKLLALSVKHEDIKEALPNILKELAVSVAETKQLNMGERLYGIWVRNDLARFIHEDVESLEPTSATLVRSSDDLSTLAEMIPATHFARYLDLITRVYPEDWQRISLDLLKNSSGKFTAECFQFLMERDCEELLSATLQRWLLEQNLKAPVLVWILKNRNSRKYAKAVRGLMTPRLLSAVFFAIDYEALQSAGNRRIPLADLLVEEKGGGVIEELLADADKETAHDLATTLLLNQGFEDLSKKFLLARFIKMFPSVQNIVDGEANEQAPAANEEALIVSQSSLDIRKKEYEHLISVRIPKNKEDIAEARAHGDLRENAEYKMARQEQDLLLARKAELERDMGRARVTDFADAPNSIVGVGSVVELEANSTKERVTYSILGAWDGDPDRNILSYQTPLARALISAKVGDKVSVDIEGHQEGWKVRSIKRWVDKV